MRRTKPDSKRDRTHNRTRPTNRNRDITRRRTNADSKRVTDTKHPDSESGLEAGAEAVAAAREQQAQVTLSLNCFF